VYISLTKETNVQWVSSSAWIQSSQPILPRAEQTKYPPSYPNRLCTGTGVTDIKNPKQTIATGDLSPRGNRDAEKREKEYRSEATSQTQKQSLYASPVLFPAFQSFPKTNQKKSQSRSVLKYPPLSYIPKQSSKPKRYLTSRVSWQATPEKLRSSGSHTLLGLALFEARWSGRIASAGRDWY